MSFGACMAAKQSQSDARNPNQSTALTDGACLEMIVERPDKVITKLDEVRQKAWINLLATQVICNRDAICCKNLRKEPQNIALPTNGRGRGVAGRQTLNSQENRPYLVYTSVDLWCQTFETSNEGSDKDTKKHLRPSQAEQNYAMADRRGLSRMGFGVRPAQRPLCFVGFGSEVGSLCVHSYAGVGLEVTR